MAQHPGALGPLVVPVYLRSVIKPLEIVAAIRAEISGSRGCCWLSAVQNCPVPSDVHSAEAYSQLERGSSHSPSLCSGG